MALNETNKQLHLDKQTLATLSLAQEGIIGPIDKLMNKNEATKTNQEKQYKNYPMPFSFILAPNGKRNQQNIINSKHGDILDIVVDGKIKGKINVEGHFKIDKYERMKNVFGIYDENDKITNRVVRTFGDYAVSGSFEVHCDKLKQNKQKLKNTIQNLNAKNIAGVMLGTTALNRAHERLIRIALEKNDMLVIFLKQPNNTSEISYSIREKTLKYFIKTYLPSEKIVVIPLENTYLFYGYNNLLLQCIIAANFGCNEFILGYSNRGVAMYYDHNQAHISFDDYINKLPIKVTLFPKFVFCNECKTLVSTKTCPHGTHHHIKYHSKSIKELLLAGILPPALFVRRDISSMILSELYPDRFKNVQAIYDNLFPNNGLLEPKNDKDFYEELMKVYQTTSLV